MFQLVTAFTRLLPKNIQSFGFPGPKRKLQTLPRIVIRRARFAPADAEKLGFREVNFHSILDTSNGGQ